jgi:hypothetical protein
MQSKYFFREILARLRGFADFQDIRTWKINDLGKKVITTGGRQLFRIRGLPAAFVPRAGATKPTGAD